jgi:oligoribonuclease
MKLPEKLVWVDLETEGLGDKVQILEVAIVLTDNRLRELAFANWVVRPRGLHLDGFVLGMHTRNGLLGDLRHGEDIANVDVMAAGLVRVQHAAGGPICGSSPHTDKRWLDLNMPNLAECFNHRTFDVSTLKLGHMIECGPSLVQGQELIEQAPAHRALADIRYSIQCAREILGLSDV